MEKALEQIPKMQNKLDDILGSILFLAIMSGRKISKEYMKIAQLGKLCGEVYSQVEDGSITKNNLEDIAMYIIVLHKYQEMKIDWDKTLKKYEEELSSINLRLKFIPIPSQANLNKVFQKFQNFSKKKKMGKEGD